MADEIAYTWHGIWDAGAQGYQEFFGGDDGLPARDLTVADVAGLTDVQRAKLESETGRRLYRAVKQVVKRASADANGSE